MKIKLLLVIVMGLLSIVCKAQQDKKPNILFIMSDDHTSQAVGVYGGRLQVLNPSPTIDKLASEGIVMQNAFCANAICTPSRASIMTGQFSAVNGILTLSDSLPVQNQYLAQEMKKAGYQTAVIGKWHLKNRPESFDYYKVLFNQGEYFDPIFAVQGTTEPVIKKETNPWRIAHKGPYTTYENAVQMKGHSTDCIAGSALEWFKEKRNPDKPFFLKLHFKAPHGGFESAPRYNTYLEDVHIPEPENLLVRGNHGSIATRGYKDELLPYMGTSIGPRSKKRNYSFYVNKEKRASLSDEEITKQAYQSYLKRYLRCVKGIDDNLKRVIDYLKEEGIYDNTIVIYTGDQGFYLGEHDYIDKRWGYEEGMRMPFIVRYPKAIKAGSTSDAIIENVDYPAMMLDYAGIPTPDYMHGRSFRSIMETGVEPKDWKKSAYYHYWMHMAHHDNPAHIGIRTKKYKLLYFYGSMPNESKAQTPPGWELYDLEKDPSEMNNIYDDPQNASVVQKLKSELQQLRAQYGEDNANFECNKVIDDYWDYDATDKEKAIEISHTFRKMMESGNTININGW